MQKTLIVVANPEPRSLTHVAAHAIRDRLPAESAEIADLHHEGFDPTFTLADRLVYQRTGETPADVLAEQRRLEAVDHLVLAFPVYWWSMPALMKGWIDRIFVNGWAFDYDSQGLRPRLGWLTTHLLPVASSDAAAYVKHGYAEVMGTQIEHGIVDYCGSQRGVTSFIYESEQPDEAITLARVGTAPSEIANRITATHG